MGACSYINLKDPTINLGKGTKAEPIVVENNFINQSARTLNPPSTPL